MTKKKKIHPNWPIEVEQELKRLWDSTLTAREIGAKLGFTRNAIIGKVQRLKLTPRNFRDFSMYTGSRPRKPTVSTSAKDILDFILPDTETSLLEFEPGVGEYTFFDNPGCKYAYGNSPPYTYCGKPGIPYCEMHRKRIYVKS